jgi:hypothetical protein
MELRGFPEPHGDCKGGYPFQAPWHPATHHGYASPFFLPSFPLAPRAGPSAPGHPELGSPFLCGTDLQAELTNKHGKVSVLQGKVEEARAECGRLWEARRQGIKGWLNLPSSVRAGARRGSGGALGAHRQRTGGVQYSAPSSCPRGPC